MPLIINRSADGTPIFSFVGLGTDGSLGADGSQCDAPLPARRKKKVLPLMSYRRKKRADDEAWGAPAARRRPAPAPAHPVMDYNNWTRDLERDSVAGPVAPEPGFATWPRKQPAGAPSPEPSPTRASKRAAKLERMRDLERENARLLERLKFDAAEAPEAPADAPLPAVESLAALAARTGVDWDVPAARAPWDVAPAPAAALPSPLRAKLVKALAEQTAPEAPPEEEEIPVLERMRRAAAERDEAARRRANAAAKKLSPKRKRPALKKSASAPANLSPPKPGAACRARAAARAAREQREAGLAAGDEFLEAQMKRMGISGGALRVERKHRYARALEKPSGYDARRKATPPAPPELHLANHERLLKKYERSLVASNGLEGDRTPLAEDLTPYRALVSLAPEAFEMDPATGATGALRRRSFDDGPAAGEDAAALEARFREIMA